MAKPVKVAPKVGAVALCVGLSGICGFLLGSWHSAGSTGIAASALKAIQSAWEQRDQRAHVEYEAGRKAFERQVKRLESERNAAIAQAQAATKKTKTLLVDWQRERAEWQTEPQLPPVPDSVPEPCLVPLADYGLRIQAKADTRLQAADRLISAQDEELKRWKTAHGIAVAQLEATQIQLESTEQRYRESRRARFRFGAGATVGMDALGLARGRFTPAAAIGLTISYGR